MKRISLSLVSLMLAVGIANASEHDNRPPKELTKADAMLKFEDKFDKADVNNDDKLSMEERKAMHEKRKQLREERRHKRFNKEHGADAESGDSHQPR